MALLTRIDMKILDLVVDVNSGTISSEIHSDSGEKYFLLMNSLGAVCSCLGDQMRPRKFILCRHKKLFFSHLSELDIDLEFLYEVDKNVTFLKTGLSFIDDLFGGIPYRQLFGLVGTHQSGKTTLAYQLLHDITFKENQDTLFIDGEGGVFDFTASHWVNIFNKKYGTDIGIDRWELNYGLWDDPPKKGKKKTKPKIQFDHIVNSKKERRIHILDLIGTDGYEPIEKLNLLVGKPVLYKISAGGKISIKPQPSQLLFRKIPDIPLSTFIAEHEIIGLVLDSLTMVVDTKYSGETEAFPARAKNNMQINNQLQLLTSYNNLYSIVNHHLTKNPTNVFDIGQMTGGKGTGHNYKFQALLDQYGSSPNKRWIKILRSQTTPAGIKSKFMITSNGIEEFEEDE